MNKARIQWAIESLDGISRRSEVPDAERISNLETIVRMLLEELRDAEPRKADYS